MKSPYASKLNWLGAALMFFGALQDPAVQAYMGDLFPPVIASKVTSAAGLLVILLRTFFTSEPVGPTR